MLGAIAALAAGCTGLSLDENGNGQDTWVDPDVGVGEHGMGAIAVERDEDQLWVVHEEERDGLRVSHLTAIDAATGVVHEVMDVTGTEDRRVVFPADDRMLLLAQEDGEEHLVLFDTDRREPIASRLAPTWYWGTRRSPSGRFLAVADNDAEGAPIHIIDLATLETRVLPQDTDALEGMWYQGEDVLLTVGVTDPFGESPAARIRRYDLRGMDGGDALPDPDLDLALPGVDWDGLFSFTWITVSPDDRWAAFPLRKGDEHRLFVLDLESGELASMLGRGPVGFTPDARRLVSYDYLDDGDEDSDEDSDDQVLLRLIDPVTHAAEDVPIEIALPSFFVGHERNDVVVTSAIGGEDPVLHYRVDDGTMTEVRGAASADLTDFVAPPGRDELWLASAGALLRVDLAADALEDQDLPFELASVNVRPVAGELALGESEARVWRFDLADRALVGDAIALPSPFERDAQHGLPTARRAGRRAAVAHAVAHRAAQSAFDPAFRREQARSAAR